MKICEHTKFSMKRTPSCRQSFAMLMPCRYGKLEICRNRTFVSFRIVTMVPGGGGQLRTTRPGVVKFEGRQLIPTYVPTRWRSPKILWRPESQVIPALRSCRLDVQPLEGIY